jgi:hypothetical protein
MQSELPLTLILSPLRAGRGELERTCIGSLLGDADKVPPKVPLSLPKRERVRVRVRLDCMVTAKQRTFTVSNDTSCVEVFSLFQSGFNY